MARRLLKPRPRGYTHSDRRYTPEEAAARQRAKLPGYYERNRGQACEVTGCYRPRIAISRFCNRHRTANTNYGHPEARVIRWLVLKPTWIRVQRLLPSLDQEAVTAALAICDRLVIQPGTEPPPANPRTAEDRRKLRLLRELYRLAHPQASRHPIHTSPRWSRPVTAEDVLLRVIAVVCAVWLNPKLLPVTRDDRCLSYAIGRAVLHLRAEQTIRAWVNPTKEKWIANRPPVGGACYHIGEQLRSELWPLFILVKPRLRLQIERGQKWKAMKASRLRRRQELVVVQQPNNHESTPVFSFEES